MCNLDYDRRAVEQAYGLEDGELDGVSIRGAEHIVGCEVGELDKYIDYDDDDVSDKDSGEDHNLDEFIKILATSKEEDKECDN